jgi:hypothetical protein
MPGAGNQVLLVKSLSQIVQVCSNRERCLKGTGVNDLFKVIQADDNELLAIAVDK